MTTVQWKLALSARPFKPFTVRTADGREYSVDHPENAWATPGGRVVFIAIDPDGAVALDLLLVTALEPVGIQLGPPPPATPEEGAIP
jgi:hypothetical protein